MAEKLEIIVNLRDKEISIGGLFIDLSKDLIEARLSPSDNSQKTLTLKYTAQKKPESPAAQRDREEIYSLLGLKKLRRAIQTKLEYTPYNGLLIPKICITGDIEVKIR